MYGGDPPPAPVTNNYEETMRDALQAQIDLAPDLYQAEMGKKRDPDTGNFVDAGGGSREDYANLERDILLKGLTDEDNGLAKILAGGRNIIKSDGSIGRPGFDQLGNWKGTAQLEEDMRYAQQVSQVRGDIGLVQSYQNTLTNALRGGSQGSLQKSINRAKQELAIDTDLRRQVLTPQDNQADVEKIYKDNVSDIDGPEYTQPISYVRQPKKGISADTDFTEVDSGGLINDVSIDPDRVRDINLDRGYNKIGEQVQGNARDIGVDQLSSGSINAKNISTGAMSYGTVGTSDVSSSGVSNQDVSADAVGDLGGLRSSLSGQAMSDLALGGSLSDEERRQIEEDARASAVARGRGRDTASIVDEVANLESARRQRLNERRAFAQGVAGQEAQLRQVDMGQNMQADLANQQANLQAGLANQSNNLQAQQLNQQAQLQSSMANVSNSMQAQQTNLANNLRAQELNQASDLRAQEINQANQLQAGLANQSNALRAQELNQAKDIQFSMDASSRALQADQLNQQADSQARDRYQQGQLAGIARDQALEDRELQAKLANQQASIDESNRAFQANQINANLEMQANQLDLQGQTAEANRLRDENALIIQRDATEAQRIQAENQANLAVNTFNAQQDMSRAGALAQNLNQNVDRRLQSAIANNQSYFQSVAMDSARALNEVQMEQATSADAMLALTGRPSGQTQTIGQSTMGNAGGGLSAGPTLYNPAQGAEFMANQASMINNYNASTYGAQQAREGAIIGGLASAVGSIGGAKILAGCWVAREVYGADNPRWVMFRYWLYNEGPTWFKLLYIMFGERFAQFIKDKPSLKQKIRKWMDSKIKEVS